jgi:Cu/Ag efflux protein CusF
MSAPLATLRRRFFCAPLLAALASTLPGRGHAQVPQTSGEVAKIDKAQGRLTLKQAEIKHLDMPAMTMAWRVRDPKWLDTLAVGDRVRFQAERIDGVFMVTAIAKLP